MLHGWQSRRPPEHWHWQLVESLRREGEQVLYPQLPDPESPSLHAWTELARAELAQLGDGERVVVAHSLGVVLWLHLATVLQEHERVERVLLVSPPSPSVLAGYAEVEEFSRVQVDADALRRAAGTTRMVCSDGDPWCPEGATVAFPELAADVDELHGAGHINVDAGYGDWPSALEWCRDPATRLVTRPV